MEEIRVGLASLAGWILCCACSVNAPKGSRFIAFICGAMGGTALGVALVLR